MSASEQNPALAGDTAAGDGGAAEHVPDEREALLEEIEARRDRESRRTPSR